MSNFKQQFMPVAVATAQKYGLDPVMFAAQLEQESGWNPAAKSSAGAKGIAQFMPATAKEMGLANPLDPVSAIDAAARYMVKLKDQLGSEDLARQAYNGGIGTVQRAMAGKGKLPTETAGYNPAIEKRAKNIAQELGMQPAQASARPKGKTTTADAAALALQEMNAGLPSGTLAQQAQAAQAPSPAAMDWRQSLAQMAPQSAPASMEAPDFDVFAEAQDLAARNQDMVMASMFGDVAGARREDTSILPSSVDRYLDRLLA